MVQRNDEQVLLRLSPAYEDSCLNPVRAEKYYPGLGAWYAAFAAETSGMHEDKCMGRTELREAKEWLAVEAEALFRNEKEESAETLECRVKALWKRYLLKTAEAREFALVKELTAAGEENPYETILKRSNPEDTGWMEEYGLPVTELEREMMRFWFSVPETDLVEMGNVIADAFLHGFISQSRDRRGRRRVRFFYQLGQEALAKKVVEALENRGLCPVITAPRTVEALNQCHADHQFDFVCGMDEELFRAEKKAYESAMEFFEEALKDTCGMIGIDQFGMEPVVIRPCKEALAPDAQAREWSERLSAGKAELESEWIRPSEISFCKIAFPNKLVGEHFEEIFRDFFSMNRKVSKPYELQQQTLIDGMDQCEYIEIKGCKGNETDIRISLWPIRLPEKETKFLNCGGDLNIPYGEVFTTPRLEGTNGLFHVEEICLKGGFYHDLRLRFENGWVTEADCREGKDYVKSNLLSPQDRIPMGEFAIGTNTSAYAIAEKYGIGSRLPILIYEKMGPHIAIGDPCFARSEDAPIYNMYDGKEMVCRENEVTQERNEKKNVYFGKHIDITLPYHQVAYLRGAAPDGKMVYLIQDGKFVLEGTNGLNEGIEE